MGVKFFGQFLLERGVLDAQQLLAAIELQHKNNLKFGEYAVAHGYVTAAEVEQIKNLQQTRDIMFGEAAVELGILSAETVATILQKQKNDHLLLGEALLRLGYLDEDTLQRELAVFKAEQAPFRQATVTAPAGAGALGETAATSVDMLAKMLVRVAHLQAKLGELTLEPLAAAAAMTVTRVSLWGKPPLHVTLAIAPAVAAQIATAFFGNDDAADPELVADACREFINITVGNIVAKLVQAGAEIELSPPSTLTPAEFRGPGVYGRVVTPHGDVLLRLSDAE